MQQLFAFGEDALSIRELLNAALEITVSLVMSARRDHFLLTPLKRCPLCSVLLKPGPEERNDLADCPA